MQVCESIDIEHPEEKGLSGGGFTASAFFVPLPRQNKETMKKLAILCALVCALVACEKPMNNVEERTASFSTRVGDEVFEESLTDFFGKKVEPVLYLVSEKTLEQINEYHKKGLEMNNCGVSSWKSTPPVDSNYVDTPYDLIDLFRTGQVSAIQENYAYSANYQDIPYGDYALIYAFCIPHQDTLKLFSGFYTPIVVNEQINNRIVNNPLRTAMVNAGWRELSILY